MTAPQPPAIAGFTFDGLLGSGGFGDVFRAQQELPRREVAIKVLRAPVRDNAARARFEAEANATAALSSHPAIVTVHFASVTDDDRPYLVMEYCSRPTLAARYRARPLAVSEVLQTMIRLAGAVETAHRAGILHGDIKPANILTTDYGWPALTDFGLSTLIGDDDREIEAVSVPWAAPEVVSGRGHDHRADIYSLGATAYTLLAGHSPFATADSSGQLSDDGVDTAAFVSRVLATLAPPISRDDVPEPLDRLIALTLAKDPADRPQTASAFARALQRIEQDLRLPATPVDVPAAPVTDLYDDVESEVTRFVARASSDSAREEPAAESAAIGARTEGDGEMDAGGDTGAEADDDGHTRLAFRSAAPTAPSATPRSLVADAGSPHGDDLVEGTVRVDRRAELLASTEAAYSGEPSAFAAGSPADVAAEDADDATRLTAPPKRAHAESGQVPAFTASPAFTSAPDAPAGPISVNELNDRTVADPSRIPVAKIAGQRRAYDPGVDGIAAERYEAREVIDAPIFRSSPDLERERAEREQAAKEERRAAAAEAEARRRRRRRLRVGYVALGIVSLAVIAGAAWLIVAALTP